MTTIRYCTACGSPFEASGPTRCMRRCPAHRMPSRKKKGETKSITVLYPGCGLEDRFSRTEFFERKAKCEFMPGTVYRLDGVEHMI